ncbi:hypothetical protein MW887_000554 [Aspergillus wentii]|nr:hypothetical protein MW887_000554 [Aspergillus wentii]
MAQAFSEALDSAFSLDSDVPQLSQTIDHKRQQMIIQNRELEELQQKIREAEERLKARQSVVMDGSSSRNGVAGQRGGEYRPTGSTFSSSPSGGAGQYFRSDQQRMHGKARNS